MKVKIKVKITKQDIGDILTTAFEGGIGYWCKKVETMSGSTDYAEIISAVVKGSAVRFYEIDSDNSWLLGKASLRKGLSKYFQEFNSNCIYSGTIDTGEIDSDDADTIIQLALFNEIVFN